MADLQLAPALEQRIEARIADDVKHMVRLLMQRPITEEIVWDVNGTPGFEHLDIVNGNWVGFDLSEEDVSTGEQHGWIEALIINTVTNWTFKHKQGRVYPGDVVFVLSGSRRDIQHKREPDVAYVQAANVRPTKGFIYRAPDLAVEIVSPSQTVEEMLEKADEYLQFGTQQVWVVAPDEQRIVVKHKGGDTTGYGMGDTLPGGTLLPEYSLDVAWLFSQ